MRDAKVLAKTYRAHFGFSLYGRLCILSHRHPDVTPPNFISWEGATLTGADTTAKIRQLLHQLNWSD